MSFMPSFLPVWMMPGSMKVLASRMSIGDGGGVHHDFEGDDAALLVGAGNELLANDAAQGFADHDADLAALIDGEDVEDAVERAGGIGGVQRADDEVARFRSGDGELDGLQVAHFTNHDDIGIFTQAARRAAPKESVWVWTSRWVTWQPADSKMYSIGSSSVMM